MPKVSIRNLHPGMGPLHIAPAVGVGSSCHHTDLIDEVALEFPSIGDRKPASDPSIGGHIGHKLINDHGIEDFPPS